MTTPVTTRQSLPDTTQQPLSVITQQSRPLPTHDKDDEKTAPQPQLTIQQPLPDHDEDDEKSQPVVFHLNNTDSFARFDDDDNN